MNLVGKIFTVLIFVMSLVFMTFTTMVYSTHKNWMTLVTDPKDGYAEKLKRSVDEREKLRQKQDDLNKQYETEKARAQKVLGQLETENQELRDERIKNELKIKELDEGLRKAVGAMAAAQEELKNLRGMNETLRGDIKVAIADRDAKFKEVVRLTDELNNVVNERVALLKRQEDLVAELAKLRKILRTLAINPDTFGAPLPAHLVGQVTAVPTPELCEISVGSDDGVQKGHKFEVLRGAGGGAEYVGRIEVIDTSVDRAVCRVDKTMLRKPIQRGDRVQPGLSK